MTDTRVEWHSRQNRALVFVKTVHTAIWAFFAACILALPVAGGLRRFDWAVGMTGLVLIECGVLAVNGWRCPLTAVAERFTADRAPDSDIYLPKWLAEHNKALFGTLFVLNETIVLWQWLK
jgi:hypothetical protein